jgi:hypothetical protein
MPLKRPSKTPKSAIPSFVIFAIARAPDAAGLPFEIGERGIGHKPRGIAGRYINLSDDQIREGFREMFERMATLRVIPDSYPVFPTNTQSLAW